MEKEIKKNILYFLGGILFIMFLGATGISVIGDTEGNYLKFFNLNKNETENNITYTLPTRVMNPNPTNANGTAVIVQSVDGAGNPPLVDNEIQGLIPIVDVEHWANHNGLVYGQYFNFTLNTAQERILMLCNQNTSHFHLTHMHLGSTAGPIRAEFWEKPIITTNGTKTNLTRLNRGVEYFNITMGVDYYVSPTINNSGTLLVADWLLGTNNQAENIFNLPYEWIFEHNTCYLLKIINENGNNVFVHGAFNGIDVEAHN